MARPQPFYDRFVRVSILLHVFDIWIRRILSKKKSVLYELSNMKLAILLVSIVFGIVYAVSFQNILKILLIVTLFHCQQFNVEIEIRSYSQIISQFSLFFLRIKTG